jgi:hypothetical protein
MPDIRITGEQAERLRDLQDRIERELVGKYGHVRPSDAVEYLLDRYESDAEAGDDLAADHGAPDLVGSNADAAIDGEAADGGDDEDGAADDAGSDADPAREGDGHAAGETRGRDDERESDAESADADDAESADGKSDDDAVDGGDGDDNGDGGGGSDGDGGDGDDGGNDASGAAMLDSMMNLLDTHGDKWGEADAGDERYEVELPDGSVETARTKDDVRALLFRHYR